MFGRKSTFKVKTGDAHVLELLHTRNMSRYAGLRRAARGEGTGSGERGDRRGSVMMKIKGMSLYFKIDKKGIFPSPQRFNQALKS